jgi:hypothetical protein
MQIALWLGVACTHGKDGCFPDGSPSTEWRLCAETVMSLAKY